MTYRYVYGCRSCGERSVHEITLFAWIPECGEFAADHAAHRCCDGTIGRLDLVGYEDSEWKPEPIPPGDVEDMHPELPPHDNKGWTSVDDRLPGFGWRVLAIDGDGRVVVSSLDLSWGWDGDGESGSTYGVTHWRPLPALPEGF